MKREFKQLAFIGALILGGAFTANAQDAISHNDGTAYTEEVSVKRSGKDNVAGQPYFKTDKERVSLSMLNLDRDVVEVVVRDERDRVLFQELIKGEATIGKSFDFSQAVSGVYTIEVRNDQKRYQKLIVR